MTWADHAKDHAKIAVQAAENEHLHQCEGTWFVGLDALPNDEMGRVRGGAPLQGEAVEFVKRYYGGWPALHKAQISVLYPGYPKPRTGENDAGFRYRKNRDAAHVDGIIGLGEPKRRFVQEPHAFIIGVPLTTASETASPLVVWEGSHHIMRTALQSAFAGLSPEDASALDVTEIYQNARRLVFESCPRVPVHGDVGSAMLVHRLALHGVAPWADDATADPEGRMIAYFRPEIAGGITAWLSDL
ncbi:MAG: hypothetical protein R8G34_00145 [Paracoccaceae bacterium]|nr:hypothetical protein [Paracoccaceae bacterium]